MDSDNRLLKTPAELDGRLLMVRKLYFLKEKFNYTCIYTMHIPFLHYSYILKYWCVKFFYANPNFFIF